jgi:hypothetical protein
MTDGLLSPSDGLAERSCGYSAAMTMPPDPTSPNPTEPVPTDPPGELMPSETPLTLGPDSDHVNDPIRTDTHQGQ